MTVEDRRTAVSRYNTDLHEDLKRQKQGFLGSFSLVCFKVMFAQRTRILLCEKERKTMSVRGEKNPEALNGA